MMTLEKERIALEHRQKWTLWIDDAELEDLDPRGPLGGSLWDVLHKLSASASIGDILFGLTLLALDDPPSMLSSLSAFSPECPTS